MAGISSKAAGKLENKRKWNAGSELESKEFSDGSGLDLYATEFRTVDPQIGRFLQIDPLADEEGQEKVSPYHFALNNPIRYNDPTGKCIPCIPIALGLLVEAAEAFVTATLVTATVDATGRKVAQNVDGNSNVSITMIPNSMNREILNFSKTVEANSLEKEVKSLEKSTKSLEKNVKEHEQKLADYKKDPDKYDNKSELKDVSVDLRQKKIDGRVKSLEAQIKKNQGELDKANKQLEQKKQELAKTREDLKD